MLKIQPKSLFVGQKQIYLPYCHSTNDVALELSKKSDFFDGTLVITDFQTAGRGQRGTVWESSSGQNLTMSLLIDSSFLKLQQQFELSMCAAVAALAAIKSFFSAKAEVKWPNDLYLNNKKVGGILIENSLREGNLRTSVIGVGINISQTTFENPRATSLFNEGIEVSREVFSERFCEYFETYLLMIKQGQSLRDIYLINLLGMNEKRKYVVGEQEFYGVIKGIDKDGLLIVDSEFSQKTFDIKEITFCF